MRKKMTFWLTLSLLIHVATLTAIDVIGQRHFIKIAAPGPFRVTLIEPKPYHAPVKKAVKKKRKTFHPVKIRKQRVIRTISHSPVVVHKQRIVRRIKRGAIPTRNPREERLKKTIERIRKQVSQRKSIPSKPTPPVGGGALGEKNIYFSVIRNKIMQAWIIPENLIENIYDLKAVVNFTIYASGHISNVYLEESSGNRTFDESAIRAVKQAAPFPPLPSSLGKKSMEIGIRFRPEEKKG